MAGKDIELSKDPTPPRAPKNPFARDMEKRTDRSLPGIDKRMTGNDETGRKIVAFDWGTPRDLSTGTRGPLSNLAKDDAAFVRAASKAGFGRDFDKRPLHLKGDRSMRGGKR